MLFARMLLAILVCFGVSAPSKASVFSSMRNHTQSCTSKTLKVVRSLPQVPLAALGAVAAFFSGKWIKDHFHKRSCDIVIGDAQRLVGLAATKIDTYEKQFEDIFHFFKGHGQSNQHEQEFLALLSLKQKETNTSCKELKKALEDINYLLTELHRVHAGLNDFKVQELAGVWSKNSEKALDQVRVLKQKLHDIVSCFKVNHGYFDLEKTYGLLIEKYKGPLSFIQHEDLVQGLLSHIQVHYAKARPFAYARFIKSLQKDIQRLTAQSAWVFEHDMHTLYQLANDLLQRLIALKAYVVQTDIYQDDVRAYAVYEQKQHEIAIIKENNALLKRNWDNLKQENAMLRSRMVSLEDEVVDMRLQHGMYCCKRI